MREGKAWQAGGISPCSHMNAIRFFVVGVELVIPSPELWTFRMAEPGPLSVGQPRYGTHGASTLEPGIRGALEVHVRKWLQSGRPWTLCRYPEASRVPSRA